MKNRKILVAYYGLPRATTVCLPVMRERIIDVLAAEGAEVGETGLLIFQESVSNARSNENAQLDQQNYRLLEGVCEPFVIDEAEHRRHFDRLKEFGDHWGDNFASTGNMLRQLLCLRALADKIRDVDYDIVVLSRVDLYCHRKLTKREVTAILQGDKIIVPAWGSHRGLNDRFMICPKKYADTVLRRIDKVADFCEQRGEFHSETFLDWVVQTQKLPIGLITFPMSRVRVGGMIRTETFKPKNVRAIRKFFHTHVHRHLPVCLTYRLGWYY